MSSIPYQSTTLTVPSSPHDGKNITIWQATRSIREIYGFSLLFAGLLSVVGAVWLGSGFTFSLADLCKHNGIEHDGSLTRPDVAQPTDRHAPTHCDPDRLNHLLGKGADLTLDDLVAIRKARNDELVKQGRPLSRFHRRLANGEVAFTFLAWSRPDGTIPEATLRAWFTDDRLPDDWTKESPTFHSFMKIRQTVDLVASKLVSLKKQQ
jgi:hypothetical protein